MLCTQANVQAGMRYRQECAQSDRLTESRSENTHLFARLLERIDLEPLIPYPVRVAARAFACQGLRWDL